MKKKHSGPQIVAKLRQADVLIGQGKSVPEVCRHIEVSQQSYYRWRRQPDEQRRISGTKATVDLGQ